LERSWRFVATASAFAVFGAGAVLVTVLWFAPLALVPSATVRRRAARAVIRTGYRLFLGFLDTAGVVGFDVEPESLARLAKGGNVIVANHPTLLDVMVLLAYVPQTCCVVKHTLFRNPFVSLAIRAAGYVPNRDPEQLLRDCDAALARGEPLIVFPEATRSVPGEPLRLQRGAAAVALNSGAVLNVVHFRCEPVLLSKGDPWYRIPERRPCLAARLGASLRARDFRRSGENRSVAARQLTLALERELSGGIHLDARAGTRAQTAIDRSTESRGLERRAD
jgi:1-acyl-sn-glycerol-3-phosphate acyltransferase